MRERERIQDAEHYDYVKLTIGKNEHNIQLEWNDVMRRLHNGDIIKIRDKTYQIRLTGFSAIPEKDKFATLHAVEINVETDLSQDTPIELDPYIQQ